MAPIWKEGWLVGCHECWGPKLMAGAFYCTPHQISLATYPLSHRRSPRRRLLLCSQPPRNTQQNATDAIEVSEKAIYRNRSALCAPKTVATADALVTASLQQIDQMQQIAQSARRPNEMRKKKKTKTRWSPVSWNHLFSFLVSLCSRHEHSESVFVPRPLIHAKISPRIRVSG